MARTPVNGMVLAIAASYGATKTMSAISNATSAVATLEASHGVIVSDIVQIVTSGWAKLVGRVARASAVATNDVTLESLNTSNTSDFPAAGGAGTVREVATWTTVGQILNDSVQSSGGTARRQTFQYLDQDAETSEFIGEEAASFDFTIHDDITLAGQTLIQTLHDSRAVTPFSLTARNGVKWYGAGTFFISVAPQLTGNDSVKRSVSIALSVPRMTQYSS